MPNSADDLRGLLKKIREDLGRMPKPAPAVIPAAEPERPEPRVPVVDALDREPSGPPTFYEEEPEPPRLSREQPAQAPAAGFTSGRVWPVLWQAGSLALAAAGAFGESSVFLAFGLLSFSASLLFEAFFPSGPAVSGSRDMAELARKLDGLERRVSSISFSSDSAGVPRELEEEIRELRRILTSLMKSLERTPEQAAAADQGGEER